MLVPTRSITCGGFRHESHDVALAMPIPSITVRTPARLHLGLLRPGGPAAARSGGLGIMIDRPETVVRVTSCHGPENAVRAPDAARIERWIEAWRRANGIESLPPFELEVVESPPAHAGLGSGTQLALAAIRAMQAFADVPPLPILELARSLGRSRRSAVGTAGFEHGGLVYDAGSDDRWGSDRIDAEPIELVSLPASWRFVLFVDRWNAGPSGDLERRLFEHLKEPSERHVAALRQFAEDAILPAVRRADFGAFASAVDEFGRLAGACYRPLRSGAYNDEAALQRAAWLRSAGAPMAAQSSWGPTVFTAFPELESVQQFVERIRTFDGGAPWLQSTEVLVAGPSLHGMTMESTALS